MASAIVDSASSLLTTAVSSAVETVGDWVWRRLYHTISAPLTAALEEEIVKYLVTTSDTSTEVDQTGQFAARMVPGVHYMLRTPSFYAFVVVQDENCRRKARRAAMDEDGGAPVVVVLYVPNTADRIDAAKAFMEGFVGAPFETRDVLHAGPSTLFGRLLTSMGKGVVDLGYNVPHPVELPNGIHAVLFKKRPRESGSVDELVLQVQRRPGLTLELLNESKKKMLEQDTGMVFSRYATRYDTWTAPTSLPSRPLSTVILPDALTQEVLADLQEFLGAQKWYEERGIPYKRCYLFYGPPGTGKTSFMFALAAHFSLNLCVMSDVMDFASNLDRYVNELTDTDVLLMEDIDRQLGPAETKSGFKAAGNMSNVLSLFDGGPIGASKRRITFISTNYPDKIDPVLMRDGRVDRRVFLGFADTQQVRRMFHRFYPSAPDAASVQFSRALEERGGKVVAASLQEHFIRHKRSFEDALAQVGSVRCEKRVDFSLPVAPEANSDTEEVDVGVEVDVDADSQAESEPVV